MTTWLLSTIGKRGYLAEYLRCAADAAGDEAHIIGTGNDPMTPGFHSCDSARLVPSYNADDYAESVLDLVENSDVDAVLSLADPDVALLSTLRDEIEQRGALCFFPSAAATNIAFDKWATYEFAQTIGVSAPRTSLDPQSVELGWPRVVKPRTGSASAGFRLWSQNSSTPESFEPVIYQSHQAGVEVNTEVLADSDGRVVRASAWRKLRSRHGETELAVTVDAPDLIDLSVYVAESLPLVGPADFDWIVSDGEPNLIEINTRFGGGYPVSELASAGFPEALIRLANRERLTFELTYVPGVFMMKQLKPFGGRLEDVASILNLSDLRDVPSETWK